MATTDDGAGLQLAALAEVSARLAERGVAHWLLGGWAVDFHLQRVTRAHSDVDLVVWSHQRDAAIAVLADAGFAPRPTDVPDTGQAFVREGVVVELTYVAVGPDGSIVTPGFEHWPWPEGSLGDEVVAFGGVALRLVSAAALIDTKQGWAEHVGEEPRPYDLDDVEALRAQVEGG